MGIDRNLNPAMGNRDEKTFDSILKTNNNKIIYEASTLFGKK